MSPTKLPTARKARFTLPRRLFGNPLNAAAAISFSLTFLAAGVALLVGVIPSRVIIGMNEVDVGVVLLFVPLCALLLAIIVEVVRSIMRDGVSQPAPRRASSLDAWKPGTREG